MGLSVFTRGGLGGKGRREGGERVKERGGERMMGLEFLVLFIILKPGFRS